MLQTKLSNADLKDFFFKYLLIYSCTVSSWHLLNRKYVLFDSDESTRLVLTLKNFTDKKKKGK